MGCKFKTLPRGIWQGGTFLKYDTFKTKTNVVLPDLLSKLQRIVFFTNRFIAKGFLSQRETSVVSVYFHLLGFCSASITQNADEIIITNQYWKKHCDRYYICMTWFPNYVAATSIMQFCYSN